MLNINYLDPILQGYINGLGLAGTDEFPFFLIYRTLISDGSAVNTANCCILGYHNNYLNSAPTADPGQTYGIALFDTGELFTNCSGPNGNGPNGSEGTQVVCRDRLTPCRWKIRSWR